MAKSFLILMLMAVQLLAGIGGSVFVCIKSDGSFCCFDQGASDCIRCAPAEVEIFEAQKADLPEENSGCRCCRSDTASPELNNSLRIEQFDQSVVSSQDPCGCTHILLTCDQSTTYLVRTSPLGDANHLICTPFEMPAVFGSEAEIEGRQCAFERFKPPPISSHAITVLSSVLIQC